jgi:hypothetical protein
MTKQKLLPTSDRLAALERSGFAPATENSPSVMTTRWLAVVLALSQKPEAEKQGCELRMEAIKTDLGFDTAPALERLLIEQIALCWLRLGDAEARYSGVVIFATSTEQLAQAERRLSACLGRYTRACEALARVRRLSRGISVQVNVTNQQIVAGGQR